MAGEYKAPCGCKIHVAQWTAKRKVVSQESCPLHKNAAALLAALKTVLPEGWADDDTMDHMPGIKQAREAIALAEPSKWQEWCTQLRSYAMSEAEHTVDLTADFWRECFNDGMSPEQAFRESFVEQDGI